MTKYRKGWTSKHLTLEIDLTSWGVVFLLMFQYNPGVIVGIGPIQLAIYVNTRE